MRDAVDGVTDCRRRMVPYLRGAGHVASGRDKARFRADDNTPRYRKIILVGSENPQEVK